jgi:hypothetical protein
MLTQNEIDRYRAMGPEQRYEIFLELAAWAWRGLDADGEERGRLRWELIRRQHAEGSRRLEEKFKTLP